MGFGGVSRYRDLCSAHERESDEQITAAPHDVMVDMEARSRRDNLHMNDDVGGYYWRWLDNGLLARSGRLGSGGSETWWAEKQAKGQ